MAVMALCAAALVGLCAWAAGSSDVPVFARVMFGFLCIPGVLVVRAALREL